jgi:hypothetical protein
MSYGYNPQSLKPPEGPGRSFAIGRVESSNRVKNDGAIIMKDSTSNSMTSKIVRKKVLNYLHTLKKRAEMSNDLAKKQKLPYRLTVHKVDSNRVFLDVVIVDADEKELDRISRDVTENNFGKLLDNITDGSGLIIDDLPPAA